MKGITKILLILIALAGLPGCARKEEKTVSVVTGVQITESNGNRSICRQYTHPQNIQMVLDYLRLQENLGIAEEDPERLSGTAFVIDVILSDGSHSVYYQRGGRYLSKKYHPWQKIDTKKAADFYRMLQRTPTDA